MDSLTRADLTTLLHSILCDAVKEAIDGNGQTAQLLQAYAEDVFEILENGGGLND